MNKAINHLDNKEQQFNLLQKSFKDGDREHKKSNQTQGQPGKGNCAVAASA